MNPKAAPSSDNSNEVEAAGETTPLLDASESVSASGHREEPLLSNVCSKEMGGNSIPYGQVVLLCATALVEPVAFFTIFPFVNEMIHVKGGIPEENVGFWAGLIESLFSLVQMAVMIFYGRLADRIGRKPVLVFTLTGLAISAALFGMAQSLPQMIALRGLAGLFGGSVVTTRVMIMENCTKETHGRTFSWYMFSRHMGMLIGPLIGGPLANPTKQFPKVFGNVLFWGTYPYALSTYVAGTVILSAALLSLLFLKETLPQTTDSLSAKPTLASTEILYSPGVRTILYLHFHVIVLSLAFTAMSTVMMYTSVENGGYGFSDQDIALFLAMTGGGQAIWVLMVFPYLQKSYSTESVLKLCGILWPLFLITFPTLNEVLRAGRFHLYWVIAPITWALGSSVATSLGCIQLCLNDISPSPSSFGDLNALALTISSGSRAVVPALGTSLYAAGIRSGFVDGHLGFIVLTIWALLLNVVCYRLPEAAVGDPLKTTSNDDHERNSRL